MHPAGALVESLIDEELSPRDRAVRVQPFVARHLHLGAEEERRVRVDQSSACFDAVFDGAMAKPFEPVGSAGTDPDSVTAAFVAAAGFFP